MTILEVMTEARELIATHWTQGTLARDSEGESTDPRGVNACSWDSLGALWKVTGSMFVPSCIQFLQLYMPEGVTPYQDHNTHKDVLLAWDKAIDHLKITGYEEQEFLDLEERCRLQKNPTCH